MVARKASLFSLRSPFCSSFSSKSQVSLSVLCFDFEWGIIFFFMGHRGRFYVFVMVVCGGVKETELFGGFAEVRSG